jgi:hypothetical protein
MKKRKIRPTLSSKIEEMYIPHKGGRYPVSGKMSIAVGKVS